MLLNFGKVLTGEIMIFGTAKYNSVIVTQQVRLISDLIIIQFSKSKIKKYGRKEVLYLIANNG